MPPHKIEPAIRNMDLSIRILFKEQRHPQFKKRLRQASIRFTELLVDIAESGAAITADQEMRLTVLTFKVTHLLSLHVSIPCLN